MTQVLSRDGCQDLVHSSQEGAMSLMWKLIYVHARGGNPAARAARKEGTGSPCPMLPSRYHAIGWFVSTFLRGDDGTDLNGALKLQLCGSADPDFGRNCLMLT